MKFRLPKSTLCTLAVTMLAAMPLPCLAIGGTGGKVDESIVKTVVYVEQKTGSDTNTGSKAKPVQTIGRAFALANEILGSGKPVKVRVGPGIYRESLGYGPANLYKQPFIFEGTDCTKCILTASDQWTNWEGPDAKGVYSKPWPYKWGVSLAITDSEAVEMRRYENVVVDGQMYFPKLSRDALTEATFCADETAQRLYVRPPAGVDLNAATRDAEVTTRVGNLWDTAGNRRDTNILHFYRSDPAQRNVPANIVIRNLTFENTAQQAFSLQNITNAVVENCVARNSGYSGMGFSGDKITIRHCRFESNGSMGFGCDGDNILIEDCLTERNCIKGHTYGWDGWDSSGFKCGDFTNSTVRRLVSQENHTKGMWFDTGCVGVLVEDCIARRNRVGYADGLFWENNNRNTVPNLGAQVTGLIRHCRFENNDSAGVFIAESENLILDDCILRGNASQIGMYNGPTPPRGIIANIAFANCLLVADTEAQSLFGIDTNAPSPSWSNQFLLGLRLDPVFNTDHNRYYSPRATPFRDVSGKESLTFAAWKAAHTAQGHADQTSVFLKAAPR